MREQGDIDEEAGAVRDAAGGAGGRGSRLQRIEMEEPLLDEYDFCLPHFDHPQARMLYIPLLNPLYPCKTLCPQNLSIPCPW